MVDLRKYIYEKGGLKMGSFILIVNSSCKYWFNYFILKEKRNICDSLCQYPINK